MLISEERKTDLYNDIAEPLMDLRIANRRLEGMSQEQIDRALFDLENKIWRRVKATLRIHD